MQRKENVKGVMESAIEIEEKNSYFLLKMKII